MYKKAIVGDATLITISFIIIIAVGIISVIVFNIGGSKVEQKIKEVEYSKEMEGILFNLLKQDANYKGLNNYGLILFYLNDLNNKDKLEVVNKKLNENLKFKGCWYFQINNGEEMIIRFNKIDCNENYMVNEPLISDYGLKKITKINIYDLQRKLELEFNLFNPEKQMELKPSM